MDNKTPKSQEPIEERGSDAPLISMGIDTIDINKEPIVIITRRRDGSPMYLVREDYQKEFLELQEWMNKYWKVHREKGSTL